jgi:NADH-quinone oxidoreductase subunit H
MAAFFETLMLMLVFPGALFQLGCGLAFEWLDRKLLARFQRRVGPRPLQPLIDIIKLFSKENLLPAGSSEVLSSLLPLVSLAAVLTAGMYIPVAGYAGLAFEGDLIVIMFLLSVPTLAYYLAGMATGGVYSIVGGGRSLLQYLAYEVPLIIALSGPAVMGSSWSVRGIITAQAGVGSYILFQPLGFGLALAGLIGKLKRNPLDIPKAKSEVVAGALTEYTGAKLALWHLVFNVQTVAGIFLLVNLYLGKPSGNPGLAASAVFIIESLAITVLLSAISALFARLRIDQLADLGWKWLVPLGMAQLLFVILMRI